MGATPRRNGAVVSTVRMALCDGRGSLLLLVLMCGALVSQALPWKLNSAARRSAVSSDTPAIVNSHTRTHTHAHTHTRTHGASLGASQWGRGQERPNSMATPSHRLFSSLLSFASPLIWLPLSSLYLFSYILQFLFLRFFLDRLFGSLLCSSLSFPLISSPPLSM